MEIQIFLPDILFQNDAFPDLRYEILNVDIFLRVPLTPYLATHQKGSLTITMVFSNAT